MDELALNILDIANNSTRARAKNILIKIEVCSSSDSLEIIINDDGCGMDNELANKATDPFFTTRTTRKVGMGISLFKMTAELTGGSFKITSAIGVGTTVSAKFVLSSIDRPPLGDIGSTITALIGGASETNFILEFKFDTNTYSFDTKLIKDELGENDLSDAMILNYLADMINENILNLSGGIKI